MHGNIYIRICTAKENIYIYTAEATMRRDPQKSWGDFLIYAACIPIHLVHVYCKEIYRLCALWNARYMHNKESITYNIVTTFLLLLLLLILIYTNTISTCNLVTSMRGWAFRESRRWSCCTTNLRRSLLKHQVKRFINSVYNLQNRIRSQRNLHE